jgi:DNA-binding NarL/FixJ family response regulator
MKNNTVKLILADPSMVVMRGFKDIIEGGEQRFEIHLAESLSAVQTLTQRHSIDLVLMNPCFVQNVEKQFSQIKNEASDVKWLALVYGWYDDALMSNFDAKILLTDQPNTILNTLQSCLDEDRSEASSNRQPLSDREVEVLHLLVLGLSNKEIADKLFISTYTVISHRKNISQKTGIKSVSGLTIYAVVKGIISLTNLPE